MSPTKEVFISVDIETAGPIPGEYSMLTVGACNVDDSTQTFACKIKPMSRLSAPGALEVSGLSLDDLERTGLAPDAAMRDFRDWIVTIALEGASPVFVGFNAPFDWSFVNYYFHKYLGSNPFGFSALDIKSYYMGVRGCSWSETRSSKVSADLKPKLRGDHDALHDAIYQAELFRLARLAVSGD